MSIFDDNSAATLEDALNAQATNQVNSIDNVYAKKRRQSIAQAGATGRLNSGVNNYTAGDLNAQEAGDIGGVEGNLSAALAQVPINDYATTQDDARKQQLAELIGKLNQRQKNPLLGALSGGAQGASTGAAFGPWGAVIGGVAGAGLGAYGES